MSVNGRTARAGVAMVLALAAMMGRSAAAQNATTPFVVAVWGDDDAIIPFADFDGQRWGSHWPAPVEAGVVPRPLPEIPVTWWGPSTFQSTWELLASTGGRRNIQITGTRAAGLGSGCSSNLGLTTDVPARPYDGVIAANRPGVIEPVETLTSNTAEWRTVSAMLPGMYQGREARAWKELSADFRPDMTPPVPRPMLDRAFASTDQSGQYVYFESSRHFRTRPNQIGYEHSFLTGWLWRVSSALPFQAVTIRAAIQDEDGKSQRSFYPLGVVRHGSRRFWLGTLDSYAYRGLTVLDVRRAGIKSLVLVGYAGC